VRAPADLESPEGQEPPREAGALRSWVVGGTRRFTINPRRRSGGNAQARQLLASDATKNAVVHGGWLGLVSALQRHTVHDAMAEMPQEDRHILTLAYLHGHTNHEIAQMLNVSVRTVSRRLSTALGKLEVQVRSLGIWMLAGVLVLLGHLRVLRDHQAVSIATLGAATVVALGVVAVSPAAAPARTAIAPAMGHSISALVIGDWQTAAGPLQPITALNTSNDLSAGVNSSRPATKPVKEETVADSNGCGGNPTSAPPAVPVGPRPGHATGSPVTHPGRGGCGPKA